jgi:hypothetical protein
MRVYRYIPFTINYQRVYQQCTIHDEILTASERGKVNEAHTGDPSTGVDWRGKNNISPGFIP